MKDDDSIPLASSVVAEERKAREKAERRLRQGNVASMTLVAVATVMFAITAALLYYSPAPWEEPPGCQDKVIDMGGWLGPSRETCPHEDQRMSVNGELVICKCP